MCSDLATLAVVRAAIRPAQELGIEFITENVETGLG
jgi:EAL domain-containing protein (putative c-di-GMP-specific phosphodiesterase class I)